MVEDHTCAELKGFISRCRFFVGARTHATIAAYSSAVPTLVLGYSTKSRGIAKDLFGSEENYVVPVQKIDDDMELTKKWKWLYTNEDVCRKTLRNVLPEYVQRVYAGLNALNSL